MAHQPDLSLPDTIPEYEQFRYKRQKILPFALYTLCDMDDAQLENCREQCTMTELELNEPVAAQVQCPSNSRFESLRSIIPFHIELAKKDEVDHHYFIVAVFVDSETVLLVTLRDEDGKPDKLWIPIGESAIQLGNLSIGNVGWYEVKDDLAVAAPSQS